MTPRDRRALGIGGAILLPALVLMGGVRPAISRFQALRAEIARERDLLSRERALLSAVRALDSTAGALEQAVAQADERLFAGADPLAATAGLGAYVSELARQHRVHVQQGETRPPAPAPGDLLAVEVGLRAQGDLEGTLAFLLGLERGPRLVEVARLGIERAAGPRDREPEHETLSLTLVVRGYAAAAPDSTNGGGQ
jgi:hypothetical protein